MTIAARFTNVSKQYKLGATTTSLRELLTGATRQLFRRNGAREDGQLFHWAMRDVSFEVPKGRALGLIGPNGAGKTTALKLLARITYPTSGKVEVAGRVSSLIELGAGFHPELSGRENIFLYSTILGMPLKAVEARFDEIVAFSGLERFIDTPVKRYSSGMYVRLAFSVAAHVEPDILLVDEVLAVGDAEFRLRCVERIQQLQEMETTIVFVAHNLYLVKSICDEVIFFTDGQIRAQGDAASTISAYEQWLHERQMEHSEPAQLERARFGRSPIAINEVRVCNSEGQEAGSFSHEDPLEVQVYFHSEDPIDDPNVVLRFLRADGVTCSLIRMKDYGYAFDQFHGAGVVSIRVDPIQLAGGAYLVEARLVAALDGIPLSQGQSAWFKVTGLSVSHTHKAGVFVPRVVSAHVTKDKRGFLPAVNYVGENRGEFHE